MSFLRTINKNTVLTRLACAYQIFNDAEWKFPASDPNKPNQELLALFALQCILTSNHIECTARIIAEGLSALPREEKDAKKIVTEAKQVLCSTVYIGITKKFKKILKD